jgi:hypothetical protein
LRKPRLCQSCNAAAAAAAEEEEEEEIGEFM